jgi:arylsulfatase A-like enzyme
MKLRYGIFIIFGLLNAVLTAIQPAVSQKMNVLFIAVDDLRPELGCYGNKYILSPNIDKLASEGRIFNNHFVRSALCGPSRIALLSGLRNFNWNHWRDARAATSKPDSVLSFPQMFKDNGYMTVCIGKISHEPGGVMDSLQNIHEVPYAWNKSYAPVGAWRDPWKAFFANAGGSAKNYGYGRGNDTYKHLPFEAADVPDNGYPDGLNAEEAIKQLQALKDTSFFLAVGFYKPHMPFNAPKKYWDMYDPEKIPASEFDHIPVGISPDLLYGADDKGSEPRRYRWPNDTARYIITKDRAKVLKHGYAACVSYTDAQIGKVMAALKQLGLDKNTMVVLWADHGWHLGDYGVWGKDTNFDIALRSPLIIKIPGMKAPGKSTNSIAETVDIFPTLADLCGLPAPNHLKNNGTSLKPIIQDPKAKVKDYSISVRDFAGYHGTTIRNDRYRLMINVNQKGDTTDLALFDIYERPIPHTNIADKHPDIVQKLKKELAKY